MTSAFWPPARLLPVLLLVAACSDDPEEVPDDGCDPTAVLPASYSPKSTVSAGAVSVTTTDGITSGTIDATAGGFTMFADNPYIYIDLKAGTKVEINDIDARTSSAWDIAIKRPSVRMNGGDSGTGKRELVIVPAATLADVTAAPASGYVADDFTAEDCSLEAIGAGEPNSAFGQWYDYAGETMRLSPKPEVYVIKRSDGSSTAFRITAYYTVAGGMERSALYGVEWKQL